MMRNIFLIFSFSAAVFAQNDAIKQSNDFYKKSLDRLLEVETEQKADIGSRDGDRDSALSEVPIDVITAQEIKNSGARELTRVLEKFVAGFNAPRTSITDGSDHSKIFTLRGLSPDQVLVLVNGKRLHQSSLMNVNGTIGMGTSGVDLNAIPLASVERIEILRDGAAAQYGSDAIAGVVNIILKGYAQKSEASLMYGETSKGDGTFKQSDLFFSLPLEYDGFFNISAEFRDRSKTDRAGVDERIQYPEGDSRNALPSIARTEFGEPDTLDKIVALNSEIVSKNGTVFYMHGFYDDRDSKAGAFFRRAVDDRNNLNIYPEGFLPKIAPKIKDYSLTLGSKGVIAKDILWDAGYTRGYNDFHFFVKDSLNTSLGESSPTDFDSGGTTYTQDVFSLDLSKKIGKLSIGAGAEFRRENYRIYSGQEESYILGSYADYAGAQGFPGFQPQNEVDKNRHNAAAYIDLKYEINRDLTLGVASRYEKYSDFGATLNEKLSATYKLTPDILLRSSASTGFRAPSLTQAYYTSTVSMMIDYELYQAGTFATDHPLSKALGAKELDAEKSKHLSLGAVYSPSSNLWLSLDYFYTKIDDRIMMSGEIYEGFSEDVKNILNSYGVNSARYFMNSADTATDGIDIRANYKHSFEKNGYAKFMLSYQYHDTKIERTADAPAILGESGEEILLDAYTISTIQDGQPKESIKFFMQYFFKDYIFGLHINRFGSFKSGSYEFGAKTVTDVDLTYNIDKSIYATIGVENLFDVYPDTWGPAEMIPYSQHSPFGFSGAFYYLRAGIKF